MKTAFAVARRALVSIRLAVVLMLAGTLAHAAPENGWWWNPAQGGTGFFFETQGGDAFMAGYLYAADGRATWLASNGPMPDENAYDGRLQSFANGQTLLGDYRAPVSNDAGPVSVRFSDAGHGILTWAGISVPIQRYSFTHGTSASFQPATGWWWNPDESGRGLSIELQGDRMFLAGFMYDEGGNPVWYAADAVMQSPTLFRGTLVRYADGQSLAGPYRVPAGPFNAGTVTMDFSATDLAAITIADDGAVAGMKAKVKIFWVKPLMKRAPRPPAPPPGPPAVRAALEFVGGFDEKLVITDGTTVSTRFARATFMTWSLDNNLPPLSFGYPRSYDLTTGLITLTVSLKDPELHCTDEGSAAFTFTGGRLTVNADLTYRATIPTRSLIVPVTITCPLPDGTLVDTEQVPYAYEVEFSGRLDSSGGMTGDFPPLSLPFQTYSGFWNFSPR